MRSLLRIAPVLLGLLAAGCGREGPEWLDDSERSAEIELGTPNGDAHFFLGRRDLRSCEWPSCGGYWIRPANGSTTRCDTGRDESECYVARLEFPPHKLSAEQRSELETAFGAGRIVIEGSFAISNAGETTSYVSLEAERGFVAANEVPGDGVFYEIEDNGIRCLRTLCFSLDEQKLDSGIERTISALDLQRVDLNQEQIENVALALSRDGLVVTGRNARDPHTGAVTLVATQIYLPIPL
jgi:hypothetical protein